MNLKEVFVQPVHPCEEQRYQQLMQQQHYLGALPKISETLWYVAFWGDQWVGLLSFSASALKCAARDNWIGWNSRHQYDRLKLIVNNSRFLILPDWHIPNLGSRILSLCQRRLDKDWQKAFGHPVVLLETFVDPQRFLGTVYKAANWLYVGNTKGFRRTRNGYSATAQSPKMVFISPLQADARALLCQPILPLPYRTGGTKMMLNAEQMQSLPSFSLKYPIIVALRGDGIDSPRSWLLPPRPACAGCADTEQSPIGPTASAKTPGSVSVAVMPTVATLSPANLSSAMF